jgi:hypothetical protein
MRQLYSVCLRKTTNLHQLIQFNTSSHPGTHYLEVVVVDDSFLNIGLKNVDGFFLGNIFY